jgi:hypothetical protein
MTRRLWALLLPLALGGCGGEALETRTFELRYLSEDQANRLIDPYVWTDREEGGGALSTSSGAITVRETTANLDQIERVLERFDQPRPSVMLNFQVIEANGVDDGDPAIDAVRNELQRLFRFEGYRLEAETRIGGMEGTTLRQLVGQDDSERAFLIEGFVGEVRTGETPTVTVQVSLAAGVVGEILATQVTIPAGHAVVLGTAKAPAYDGALILVVRAEIVRSDEVSPP